MLPHRSAGRGENGRALTRVSGCAAFSARWWIETGPLLIALAFVPVAVFLWEAHGAQVFGENPFRP